MKKIILFVIVAISFTNCSHTIIRSGYKISANDYKTCDIPIVKFLKINDSIQKIGEIKLGDSGFSVSCSEEQAIEILKKEGCTIGAHLINIIDETRPDFLSSCYRCKAEFYKYKTPILIPKTGEIYKKENVAERVNEDRKRNALLGTFAVIIGFTLGYLLFQ